MSRTIECTVEYEYADGNFADTRIAWNSDNPKTFRMDWEESDGYCSMNPESGLFGDSSDEDVISAMEMWGDSSDIDIWTHNEE